MNAYAHNRGSFHGWQKLRVVAPETAEDKMTVLRLSWFTVLFLTGVFATAQSVQEAAAASGSNHPPAESNSQQAGSFLQGDESRQRLLYEMCIHSADRVGKNAHAMMPARFWAFDRDEYYQRFDRLRLATEDLSQSQTAFEASLKPEQVSKVDPEIHGVHQLETEVESRVQTIGNELWKRQPAKWKIVQDTSAIPHLIKEWRNRDRKIAREIGILR